LATCADAPAWLARRFIKWTEQTFLAGGRETELLPTLERCTRELQDVPRYKDDARYLRVWVKYADCCKEPHDIFKFLQANDIGQRHTLFYEAYAAFLEIRGTFPKAQEVYERGIMMRAAPRDRLKEKIGQFQNRMERRRQRKIEEGVTDEEGNERGQEPPRHFGDGGAENPGGARGGGAVRGGGGGAAGTSGSGGRGAGAGSGAHNGVKRGRGYGAAAAGAGASGSASQDANDANINGGGLDIYEAGALHGISFPLDRQRQPLCS
jgi:checkpoint serine/threonine-protein kinase